MTANAEPLTPVLKSSQQIYQTYNVLKRYKDQILKEYGLTLEQLSVLSVISYFGGTARITDIADWLERSANSVSMIVDRMVKAGLVSRKRDRVDRRVVYVSATSKGKAAFGPGYAAYIELVRRVFQPLSQADMNTLADLLRTVKCEVLKYSNPEVDIKKVPRIDAKKLADTERWLNESGLLSLPEAKGRGKTKSKTTHRHR